eukprot:TRINITY_DN479_c0_g3_i1.p1 TRINITY_DN479_c0_g3~~TRINITY_DN479_c0_g3_i1.p1  ORF type:complete len:153 (+),score=20.37 TRINITY_DN479_c0_g3_i1:28-459(+)
MVNMFYLDADARAAASWYADNHVCKMGLEAVQVVWTVVHEVVKHAARVGRGYVDGQRSGDLQPMRPLNNAKHPLVLWVPFEIPFHAATTLCNLGCNKIVFLAKTHRDFRSITLLVTHARFAICAGVPVQGQLRYRAGLRGCNL